MKTEVSHKKLGAFVSSGRGSFVFPSLMGYEYCPDDSDNVKDKFLSASVM